MVDTTGWWPIELEGKPDFEQAMQRVYAWYEGEILDRVPVRFMAHNAAFNLGDVEGKRPPAAQKKTMVRRGAPRRRLCALDRG